MRLEMDNNSTIAVVAIAVAIAALIGVLGVCRMINQTRQKAIAAGMEQAIVTGSNMPIWVKAKP